MGGDAACVLKPGVVVIAVAITEFAGLLDSLRHESVDTVGRVGYLHPSRQPADEARTAGLAVEAVFGVEGGRSPLCSLVATV